MYQARKKIKTEHTYEFPKERMKHIPEPEKIGNIMSGNVRELSSYYTIPEHVNDKTKS